MTATSFPTAGTAVERPSSVSEAASLLRDSRGSVLIRGSSSKIGWGGRVLAPDLILETGGLQRLISHNPSDMTAAVEAGITLQALQQELTEAGQWLALDPPSQSAGATIGGLLATGDSGPRRLRYGAIRDLVIGVTLVLPDGTVAKAGGQVIKNVAGYDLSKLMYGSLGALALIAEVVVRVHPRPEATATVVVPASIATATATTIRLMQSPLEPSAVDWIGDPRDDAATGRLAVKFEGTKAGVDAQTAVAREIMDGAELLTEDAETGLWDEFVTAHRSGPDATVGHAGTLPSRLPAVAEALVAAAGEAGAEIKLASHTALGLHTAQFAGSPDQQARAFDRWRASVLGFGGTVLLRDRPADVEDAVDAVGPPPSAVNLLRAVKLSLDPDGRLAPGRLGSWL
jgi:glycolate oxidase FAD binding subunit